MNFQVLHLLIRFSTWLNIVNLFPKVLFASFACKKMNEQMEEIEDIVKGEFCEFNFYIIQNSLILGNSKIVEMINSLLKPTHLEFEYVEPKHEWIWIKCGLNLFGSLNWTDRPNTWTPLNPHYYKIPSLIAFILAFNSAFEALRKPPLL